MIASSANLNPRPYDPITPVQPFSPYVNRRLDRYVLDNSFYLCTAPRSGTIEGDFESDTLRF
jgi:hypothetical protein